MDNKQNAKIRIFWYDEKDEIQSCVVCNAIELDLMLTLLEFAEYRLKSVVTEFCD